MAESAMNLWDSSCLLLLSAMMWSIVDPELQLLRFLLSFVQLPPPLRPQLGTVAAVTTTVESSKERVAVLACRNAMDSWDIELLPLTTLLLRPKPTVSSSEEKVYWCSISRRSSMSYRPTSYRADGWRNIHHLPFPIYMHNIM